MLQSDQTRDVAPHCSKGMTIKAYLRLGSSISLRVAAQATSAELIAVGALVSSILLSVAPIVWTVRRRR